jgi:hypothetical protein
MLQLQPDSIADMYGNLSPSDGDTVVIGWGREYKWVANTSPNPFSPTSDTIPRFIIGNLKQEDVSSKGNPPSTGTVVEIRAIKPVVVASSRMDVYDIVGNVVCEKLPVYGRTDYEGTYEIFWDGRNKNNRIVGPGTYLGILYLYEEGESKPSIQRRKIGVTR